jgi:predicted component of type VI protein secretion system
MAYIVISTDGKEINRLELKEPVTLGRSVECNLCIVDPALSRQHCRFEKDDMGWWIVDLNSRNGTFIGEERITRRKLNDDDVIHAGQLRIVFHAAGFVPTRFKNPQDAIFSAKLSLDDSLADTAGLSKNLPVPKPKRAEEVRSRVTSAATRSDGKNDSMSGIIPGSPMVFNRPPARPIVKQ